VSYTGNTQHLSPEDKRVIRTDGIDSDIWWEGQNVPASETTWGICRDRAANFLSTNENVYIVDGYIGADPEYRMGVRAICGRAYHAVFLENTLYKADEKTIEADFA
jgi:phosphoenolpyruvate carboxykinase (ATP)